MFWNLEVGDKVTVCYNAAPFYPYTEYEGTVIKITKTGFIKVKDSKNRVVLYDPRNGKARGWNTLWLKERNQNVRS